MSLGSPVSKGEPGTSTYLICIPFPNFVQKLSTFALKYNRVVFSLKSNMLLYNHCFLKGTYIWFKRVLMPGLKRISDSRHKSLFKTKPALL